MGLYGKNLCLIVKECVFIVAGDPVIVLRILFFILYSFEIFAFERVEEQVGEA